VKTTQSVSGIARSCYAALIAFMAYSAVYAFRKPFTVGDYDNLKYYGISYQTLLIIAQVLGYMLSKFYGIKFISGLKKIGRWKTSFVLVGISWISLLIFAFVPPPFGVLLLFVNGFVLGFMWGIIFSYIEGRTATDFIGTVMAISFIFAGGFTRTVARWISITWSVSDFWLPFTTGALFAMPLIVLIFLLEKLPPPDATDIREKSEREPMSGNDRKAFTMYFGTGLTAVAITYFILTIMRDIRDNYMSNIWDELGFASDYTVYARTETISAVVILFLLSLIVFIRKNFRAFIFSHIIIACGLAIAGFASILFVRNQISGLWWMQATGLGLYLSYILFNCIFFERMIASFRKKGNIGFVIYFVDAFGYLGSVSIMISKSFFPIEINWTVFYSNGVILGSVIGIAGIVFSAFYFIRKYQRSARVEIKMENQLSVNPV